MYTRLVIRVFFLCLLVSCTRGSLAVSIRDLLLTGRAKVSSWPSHHALSVGSLECAGMWAQTGGEVLLRDRHPDPPTRLFLSLNQSLYLHTTTSFKLFPLILCLKNECQEAALLFSLCTWWTEETNWRKYENKSSDISFYLFMFSSWQFSSYVWLIGFGRRYPHIENSRFHHWFTESNSARS